MKAVGPNHKGLKQGRNPDRLHLHSGDPNLGNGTGSGTLNGPEFPVLSLESGVLTTWLCAYPGCTACVSFEKETWAFREFWILGSLHPNVLCPVRPSFMPLTSALPAQGSCLPATTPLSNPPCPSSFQHGAFEECSYNLQFNIAFACGAFASPTMRLQCSNSDSNSNSNPNSNSNSNSLPASLLPSLLPF